MKSKFMFFVIVCLNVMMAPPSFAVDMVATLSKLIECCPSMPILVNETSVAACMPTKDTKMNFYMFGGSLVKNRSCVLDCAFKGENLLKTMVDGSLAVDLAAVNARLELKASSGSWPSILSLVKTNCTVKIPVLSKLSVSKQCTSGAYEVSTCLYKSLLMSCPAKIGTSNCIRRLGSITKSVFQKIKGMFTKTTTLETDGVVSEAILTTPITTVATTTTDLSTTTTVAIATETTTPVTTTAATTNATTVSG